MVRTSWQYYFEFLVAMTLKEIKARYKHAVLGFLWVILNPLLQMLIIGFVFQFFVPVHVDNYFLFLFSGLLPWNFFSMTVSKNTPMIVFERGLIQKAKFPREIILLAVVLSNLFHLVVSLLLLLVVLLADKIFLDHYTVSQLLIYSLRLLMTGPILVWLTLLTSGLSLLCAAWNVKYRDVNFMVQAIMPLWFYATPIIYTLDLLPSWLHFLAFLNPMTGITQAFHRSLLSLPMTSWDAIWVGLAVTIIVVWAGWSVFKKESPFFDDWV